MNRHNLFIFFSISVALILRVFLITKSPPSLYWDEISLGYNAFTISQTAKDEHGNFLPIQAFTAYGDYKPPLYIYFSAPLVGLFGPNEITIRLISIMSGVLLCLVVYLICREIFPKNKKISILASFITALSPWSIQISRAAFEANLATVLVALGTLLFLKGVKNPRYFIISSFAFCLSAYTFNGARYFLPFWLGFLFLWLIWTQKKYLIFIKHIIFSILLGLIVLFPLIQFGLTSSGQLRFNEVNIFSDPQPVITANKLQSEHNNSLYSKIIFNRRIFYAQNFLKHYFDHYSFRYLFLTGDVNPRFSSQVMGQLYLFDLPLIIIGLFFLYRQKKSMFYLLVFWVIISPIPASVARETPHALRTLHVLPAYMLLITSGFLGIWSLVRKKTLRNILVAIIFTGYILQFGYFYINYLTVYPEKYSDSWQEGYKQMAVQLYPIKNDFNKILVTDYYGRAYANLLFYWRFPPSEFLKSRNAFSEPSGLWTVKSFSNIYIKSTVTCSDANSFDLLIGLPEDFPGNIPVYKSVIDSFGKVKFVMIKSNECK